MAEGVGAFTTRVVAKGVKVYATWPNVFHHPEYDANPQVAANLVAIRGFWEKLGIPVLGEPSGAWFDAKYMYDTSYHLNREGVAIRTRKFADVLEAIIP